MESRDNQDERSDNGGPSGDRGCANDRGAEGTVPQHRTSLGISATTLQPVTSPQPLPRQPQAAATVDDPSPWAPLKQPVYRSFWIASLVSNLGTWMHEIGAGWLMTELDASPQMVAAVRTAMATPIVLLAIPAGVLADRIDRRKLLLATQFILFCSTGTLAILAATGVVTAWVLLGLTFLIGLGLTLHVPTWQASIPELVERKQLSRAIALGSLNFNLARSVGPALAGALVAITGAWIAFSVNAFSFAGVIIVLLLWKRDRSESSRGLSFRKSLYQGFRYVYRTAELRHVMIRVMLFILPASALWGLLPLVAKQRLNWDADGFGLLVTCFGAGAVIAAKFLHRLHHRFGHNWTVTFAMVLMAVGLAVMGTSQVRSVALAATLIMGFGWMMTLTTLNTAAQTILPSRMRARGMSFYLTSLALSMSSGSLLWGIIAEIELIGVGGAQKIAAATLLCTAAIGMIFRISEKTRH
ncbi:MFS transporter [Stieleria sp. JC731]|uniref:MFS transporter n=1 Tax=Pirellulaceae TaxID=2691357 RepID=UPI001E3C327C|nr:MFS transporter [Stieleria sp. JC731]MCC9599391.1 MFS transporter [Stieleria sp. JC731]